MLGRSWDPGRAGCSSAQGGRRRRAGAWAEGFSRRLTRSRAPSTFSGGTSGPASWSTDRRRRRGAGAASGSELPVRIRPSKYLRGAAECGDDALSSRGFRARTRQQLSNSAGLVTLTAELTTTCRGSPRSQPSIPETARPRGHFRRHRPTHPGSPTPACPTSQGSLGFRPQVPAQRFGDFTPSACSRSCSLPRPCPPSPGVPAPQQLRVHVRSLIAGILDVWAGGTIVIHWGPGSRRCGRGRDELSCQGSRV